MNKIKITSLLSGILFFYSCSTIVDVNQPELARQLVLTSTLMTDSAISVYLTHSVGPLASGMGDSITNATVNLYEDGILVSPLTYSYNGIYSSNFLPQEGKKYRVEASSAVYEAINAEVIIPVSPMVDSVNASFSTDQNGDLLNGTVFLEDAAGENYYLIQAQYQYISPDTTWGVDSAWYEVYIYSDDPAIDNTSKNLSHLIFSDISFNDGKYAVRFRSDYFNGDTANTNLRYRIFSLSRESYYYWTSLQNYYETNGNPFAEPVQVYSNVSSGMGILGAVNVKVKKVY